MTASGKRLGLRGIGFDPCVERAKVLRGGLNADLRGVKPRNVSAVIELANDLASSAADSNPRAAMRLKGRDV